MTHLVQHLFYGYCTALIICCVPFSRTEHALLLYWLNDFSDDDDDVDDDDDD